MQHVAATDALKSAPARWASETDIFRKFFDRFKFISFIKFSKIISFTKRCFLKRDFFKLLHDCWFSIGKEAYTMNRQAAKLLQFVSAYKL